MTVFYAHTEDGGHDFERWEEDMAAAESEAAALRRDDDEPAADTVTPAAKHWAAGAFKNDVYCGACNVWVNRWLWDAHVAQPVRVTGAGGAA